MVEAVGVELVGAEPATGAVVELLIFLDDVTTTDVDTAVWFAKWCRLFGKRLKQYVVLTYILKRE